MLFARVWDALEPGGPLIFDVWKPARRSTLEGERRPVAGRRTWAALR